MGTIQFMNPEQATGQWDIVNRLSDIYSLRATLYVILTGQLPFVGGSLSEIKNTIRKGDFISPRSVNNTISPALDSICLRAMSKEQDQRYKSALELAEDIECWLADEPLSCYHDHITTRLTRWARRNRTLATSLVASGVITLLAVSAFATMLASANAREKSLRGQAESQALQTTIAFDKAKEAIDQYLLTVGNSSDLQQLDLVDLRRQLLGSTIPFYEWLAKNSPSQSGFEIERANALVRLSELHEMLEDHQSEQFATESLRLLNHAKLSQPDELAIPRLEVRALKQLLAVERSKLNFTNVEPYVDQLQSIFDVLVKSGNAQDQIDRLDFEVMRAEYLEVANRHAECIELINSAISYPCPSGMSDAQEKQWDVTRSRLYYLLGQQHRQFGRMEPAQRACEQAIELIDEYAMEQVSDGLVQHRSANSYYLLGQIQLGSGESEEALESFKKCEQIVNKLCESRPSIPIYRLQKAWALESQANLLSGFNRLSESNEILSQAIEVVNYLRAESPDNLEQTRLHAMLLDRSAMNASQVKNVTLAAEGFQDSLRLYQSILDRQPDMWEARLGQGWALLKLGDIYKEAAKLTDAEHCYQQVILNTDMLCEQLRDQSSATELNRHAGYVLFDVLTRMRKTEEACQLAKDQSARYSENQGFFSVLVCQCQCRRDAWDEAIGRLKNIESASTQLSPTMQFEIARTHDLIANKATDAQQKTHHVSSSLDWLE